MCGIFGYLGNQEATEIILSGLQKLAYRGYDSSGIAGIIQGNLHTRKAIGKLSALESEIEKNPLSLKIGIGHTRWATHGKPTLDNCHPHIDEYQRIAVVHNGIIENHDSLRQELLQQGVSFVSQTDTEVIAHMIAQAYEEGDLLHAVHEVLPKLKGAWALAIIHRDHPEEIIVAAHHMPLAIGSSENGMFLCSDSQPLAAHLESCIFLENGETARITSSGIEIFDFFRSVIQKKQHEICSIEGQSSRGDFEHYTLKEIFEQPFTIAQALHSRIITQFGTVSFKELHISAEELSNIERILILGCGTSYHAGCVASYLLEEFAHLPTTVEIASEFRYKNPILSGKTLVIAISQSGETADTLAAVKEAKAKGAKVLGICNVPGSALDREVHNTLFLHAGPEIGVCSTKAFTSQVIVLSLLALSLARLKYMNQLEGINFINDLLSLPKLVEKVLEQAHHIKSIALKYAHCRDFFFLGRQYMYPASLEGALKLKEISYVNANGYPAGELKHGPIALIHEECPTVALCTNERTYDKMLSNLMEVKARSGKVIAIAFEGSPEIENLADEVIWISKIRDGLAVIPATVATQLFAYYLAKERGEDIDQPRNLAKSVTVE